MSSDSPSDKSGPIQSETDSAESDGPEDGLEAGVDDALEGPRKTELSSDLDRLKGATLNVIRARERLPQPLFWSLFHAEMLSIKKRRRKQREKTAAEFDCEWL